MLKVDRSFVAALDHSRPAPAVIQAVTTLARTFGMQVVAEGVETAAQLDQVRTLGCDWGQGYFLGKPMPADALIELITRGGNDVIAA
jgi:EAL domain-containing protein (putative c-di-GMP-specific phosphodiesterase class I)